MLCVGAAAFGADAQAEAAGELSPFSGGFGDALWTIIAFVVLLVVLRKLAWKPILAALNTRQENIEKQITDADETRKEPSAFGPSTGKSLKMRTVKARV